ncbi:MAG: ATP-binding protein [Simkaniaceae bacterium]|nr:ATP-binding protein [Simkaniaceae bacterium]
MNEQEIEFPAEAPSLTHIFTWVAAKLKETSFTPKRKKEIELVLEEIVVNIIHYAYDDRPGKLTLKYSQASDRVTFTVKDWGNPFDPTKLPMSPDINSKLNQRQEGGLGLHFIHKLSDQVAYEHKHEMNHLVITFFIR